MAFGRTLVCDNDGNYKGSLMLSLKEGYVLEHLVYLLLQMQPLIFVLAHECHLFLFLSGTLLSTLITYVILVTMQVTLSDEG